MGRYHRSLKEKQQILESQGHKCAYCDQDFTVLNPPHFDHFIPWCGNGPTSEGNVFACCAPCNHRKSYLRFETLEAVREWIASALPGEIRCHQCGEVFVPKTRREQKYCSAPCMSRAGSARHYARHRERILKRQRENEKAERDRIAALKKR